MKQFLRIFPFISGALLLTPVLHAQPSGPAASPQQSITQTVGTTEVTVIYSRPGVKDRDIFGALVPYDRTWRTGANQSTKLKLSGDATIGGKPVPAGEYALYTIPGEDEWTIIVSTNTELWGAFDYDQSNDVARFQAEAEEIDDEVETFTINFSHFDGYDAVMYLAWDDVRVEFPISTRGSE